MFGGKTYLLLFAAHTAIAYLLELTQVGIGDMNISPTPLCVNLVVEEPVRNTTGVHNLGNTPVPSSVHFHLHRYAFPTSVKGWLASKCILQGRGQHLSSLVQQLSRHRMGESSHNFAQVADDTVDKFPSATYSLCAICGTTKELPKFHEQALSRCWRVLALHDWPFVVEWIVYQIGPGLGEREERYVRDARQVQRRARPW
jgi:hypothetical protein